MDYPVQGEMPRLHIGPGSELGSYLVFGYLHVELKGTSLIELCIRDLFVVVLPSDITLPCMWSYA